MSTPAIDDTLAATFRLRAVMAPVIALVLLCAALPARETWRVVALVVLLVATTVSGIVEIALLRRGLSSGGLVRNLMFMAPFVLGAVALSGGIQSPILPVLLPASLSVGFLFDGWKRRFAMTLFVGGSLAMGVLGAWLAPQTLVFPLLRSDGRASDLHLSTWVGALFIAGFVMIAHRVGRRMRGTFERAIRLRNERNEAILEGQRAQTRALSALSSEIAHELKNPLATVKGLAALVAKDVTGKAAERVLVLRREIDRMQGILDELLNFSRPLSALSLSPSSAGDLVSEVARLHEGMAAAASVTIVAAPSEQPVIVRCDPRKMLQALVNLVQNAIEASPPGGRVRIAFEARGDRVAFLIEDEGSGVPEEIRSRVFEPGVTSKGSGSGLGLTIARAIAEQHGGSLEMEYRQSGTAFALIVPVSGPPQRPVDEGSPPRSTAVDGAQEEVPS